MVQRKPYCFVEVGSVEEAEGIQSMSGSQVVHEGVAQPVEHFVHYVSTGWSVRLF